MTHTRLLICVLTLWLAAGAALAQDSSAFKVTALTDNIHLLSIDQGAYTTNTLAFVGDDGLLLVDTQTEGEIEDLEREVEAFGKGAPKYIINTHRHVEHIGGNAIWGASPVIIAHQLLPGKLRSGSFLFNEYPDETFPDITFADSLTLFFNGETIRMFNVSGSHDDNEIAVHFVESKVAHISSITNGFNFPSVDGDGDPLGFAAVVAKARDLLPEDVVIVSGHNEPGRWDEMQPYHDMMVRSVEIVRAGLAEGKDLETLQAEKVLAEFDSYAGSYVSTSEWIEYLVEAIEDPGEPEKKDAFRPLYDAWKTDGADAAVAKYLELKRDFPDEYDISELTIVVVGDKLFNKGRYADAVPFLKQSLDEYPEGRYAYYLSYELAVSYRELGDVELAVRQCERALELNPDFAAAAALLEELKK